jgi:hypothetical protein
MVAPRNDKFFDASLPSSELLYKLKFEFMAYKMGEPVGSPMIFYFSTVPSALNRGSFSR